MCNPADMKRTYPLFLSSTLLLLVLSGGKLSAQPEWTKDRLDINVAVSGAPLYAFSDYTYGAEYFYQEVEHLTNLYTGNLRSKTYGFYSIDAAYRLGKRWAVLLNTGYSRMDADFFDPATNEYLRNEADNFFSILAGGRFYWKDKPGLKLYSSVYMGLMLHNRGLDYWRYSNYDKDLFGFQITFIGCQFGRKKVYGLVELGDGDLSMGIPLGIRMGVGYRF